MNLEHEIDDRTLDRLVDGELSGAEYDELLRKLEATPAGWRRCALAFLEAQAWGTEIRAAGPELLAERSGSMPSTAPAGKPAESGRGKMLGGWKYGLVLALSCAATFALAFVFASQWRFGTGVPGSEKFAGTGQEAHSTLRPNFEDPYSTSVPVGEDGKLGRYRLVVNQESGQPRAVEMPVIPADDPRAMWLLDEYANRPRDLIRKLEQYGNRVESRRQWIPVTDEQGSMIYVPVDDLQVTPVVNRAF